MDEKIRCMTWANNLFKKLNTICVESDNMLRQEVQQFVTAVMEDVLPPCKQRNGGDREPQNGNPNKASGGIVDSNLVQTLAEAEGFGFNKSASSSNLRMRKQSSGKSCEDGDSDAGSKGNSLEQSFLRIEHESQVQEFSDSDWEII